MFNREKNLARSLKIPGASLLQQSVSISGVGLYIALSVDGLFVY
jgi:hypothetical protein